MMSYWQESSVLSHICISLLVSTRGCFLLWLITNKHEIVFCYNLADSVGRQFAQIKADITSSSSKRAGKITAAEHTQPKKQKLEKPILLVLPGARDVEEQLLPRLRELFDVIRKYKEVVREGRRGKWVLARSKCALPGRCATRSRHPCAELMWGVHPHGF